MSGLFSQIRCFPLLSARLPDGARVQVVAPPATRGDMAIAIRKHSARTLGVEDFMSAAHEPRTATHRDEVRALVKAGDYVAALKLAVRARMTLLISGGTSSGKTTFLNALLREIPAHERLIFIEDTPELAMTHDNLVGMVAARSPLGEAEATMDSLVQAALRMRPDRIIIGEVRGPEALGYLRAANTGHPGSMTTIHANDCAAAVDQLTLLVLQTGTALTREDVAHFVRRTVDVFVHLESHNGARAIREVVVS